MEKIIAVLVLAFLATNAAVEAGPEDVVPRNESFLLATTGMNHVQVYSLASTSVVREIGSDNYSYAVTYNMKNGQVYWSDYDGAVFRADFSGQNVQRIYTVTIGSGYSLALAYDWVGDNIYITEWRGYQVVICTADGGSCSKIPVAGADYCIGIALDPTGGKMYFTNTYQGAIYKANMDGSNVTEVVTGLVDPNELVIDFEASRLYWSEYYALRSSYLNGTDIRTVLEGYKTWGVAVHGDRLYFSTQTDQSVVSVNKLNGSDLRTEFTVPSTVFGITVADISTQTQGRSSQCADQPCSHICTLTSSTSFRCLCPKNMEISEDGHTCQRRLSGENPQRLRRGDGKQE